MMSDEKDLVAEFLSNGGKIKTLDEVVPQNMAARKKWAINKNLPYDKASLKKYREEYIEEHGTKSQRIRAAIPSIRNDSDDHIEVNVNDTL